MKFYTGTNERVRVETNGEIGIGGANYGTAGQVLTSQGPGNAVQWAAASSISAGARSTNPGTTFVQWTSLPANIQALEMGYAAAYTSTQNAENERLCVRMGTSSGVLSSGYQNYSWNAYSSGVGHGFSASKGAFIPYYYIDNTDRLTTMYTFRRMGTTNTFQVDWHEYVDGGHTYMAMGAGYIDLGAELTQVRFTTVNGTATLNGSYWMNYTTR